MDFEALIQILASFIRQTDIVSGQQRKIRMPMIFSSPLGSPVSLSQIQSQAETAHGSALAAADLGSLPEWNLDHLYKGLDAPEFTADLDKATRGAKQFAADYQGKLAAVLASSDASVVLHQAITRYEAIDDLLGRIISFAGLVYSGDTTDPVKAKFYGDTQDALTRISADLLFFTLELNRLDDKALEQVSHTAPLAHFKPWLDDIRLEKPYQQIGRAHV